MINGILEQGDVVILSAIPVRAVVAEVDVVFDAVLPAGTEYAAGSSTVTSGSVVDSVTTAEWTVTLAKSIPVDYAEIPTYSSGWIDDQKEEFVIAVTITDITAYSALAEADRKVTLTAPGGDADAANDVGTEFITSDTVLDILAASIHAGTNTGITTGGVVTINGGDAAKMDVALGTGVVVDWTTPGSPTIALVSWAASAAITVTSLVAEEFTYVYVDDTGTIGQQVTVPTSADRRSKIFLNRLVHIGAVSIDSIGNDFRMSYENDQSVSDFIALSSPIVTGNTYSANGANLNVDRAAGTSSFPFLNFDTDAQNPLVQTDGADVSLANIIRVFRDGGGGFTYSTGNTLIDPDNYDNDAGSLTSLSAGDWTIQRLYWVPQLEENVLIYGQAIYTSMAEAEASIFNEDPILPGIISDGILTTVLIVKEGVTDLSIATTSKFVDMVHAITGKPLPLATDLKVFSISIANATTALTVVDGLVGFAIPVQWGGYQVVDVLAVVHDKGITGQTDFQLRKTRGAVDTDVLSTKVTMGDEFYANDGIIDAAENDLLVGDILYADVDALHSGTAPNGGDLVITISGNVKG